MENHYKNIFLYLSIIFILIIIICLSEIHLLKIQIRAYENFIVNDVKRAMEGQIKQ